MERRPFGNTGLTVSVFGFGCGAVGGLMVRGAAADQERAVARALRAGVNYFDTAALYGDGESERNLGRVLATLRPADALVGTKVRLSSSDFGRIAAAAMESLDGSLRRLGRDRVDIFHLHNAITEHGGGETLSADQVLHEVAPAFERLRAAGKIRCLGITAVGDTTALHRVIEARVFNAAQVVCNLLNPSAGAALPPGFPGQDYRQLLDRCAAAGVGTIGIRVLAGGALSGTAARHPIASTPPEPIGSALAYDADLRRAQRFLPLVHAGYADSLAEAAIRFVLAQQTMSTILVGMATLEQFEQALAAVYKGKLPPPAQQRVRDLQQSFAGEPR
jgi:aryl-alcohol dehydrogenase-like predicted oxidoreductase